MKVYNGAVQMTETLHEKLKGYRAERDFNASEWVERKTALINQYFKQNKLTGAVLGLSGGIDSAVALALLVEAQKQAGSPLKKIVPVLMPAFNFVGATKQDAATERAQRYCQELGVKPALFTQLTQLSTIITEELEDILDIQSTDWAQGQLVAYTRTPILYNTCSILTDAGVPALVVGTTNLSEGGYLGYVGKASDGMVDLQIISDLYKSEVYSVAEYLNVNTEIIQATPTGDMYDGREDETVFGATYDFVELFYLWLQKGSPEELLQEEAFVAGAENLETLHRYNAHKYSYGTPSIHLDIMNATIPNGWNNTPWKG